jgi:hypothetical protein
MSGMIVERRDQVLMTRRSPAAFWVSTFLSKWSSTNGPFFRLRDMTHPFGSRDVPPAASQRADVFAG